MPYWKWIFHGTQKVFFFFFFFTDFPKIRVLGAKINHNQWRLTLKMLSFSPKKWKSKLKLGGQVVLGVAEDPGKGGHQCSTYHQYHPAMVLPPSPTHSP